RVTWRAADKSVVVVPQAPTGAVQRQVDRCEVADHQIEVDIDALFDDRCRHENRCPRTFPFPCPVRAEAPYDLARDVFALAGGESGVQPVEVWRLGSGPLAAAGGAVRDEGPYDLARDVFALAGGESGVQQVEFWRLGSGLLRVSRGPFRQVREGVLGFCDGRSDDGNASAVLHQVGQFFSDR